MTNYQNDAPMVMPVSPMAGNGNAGFGFGDGNGFWILLLFLLLGNNGWGNNFGGNGGVGGMYPWMNQANQIDNGFRDQMLNTNIAGIGDKIISGFGDVQTALCGGFAGVNAAIVGAQNYIGQQMAANQIADMQQNFALQTQLANYNAGTIAAISAMGQSIKDQMCADKIEAKDDLIAQLRSELMYARGQASQDVQTAAIQAGQRALANEVEQYVLPTPRPAYIVTNPNCCQQNTCTCAG